MPRIAVAMCFLGLTLFGPYAPSAVSAQGLFVDGIVFASVERRSS